MTEKKKIHKKKELLRISKRVEKNEPLLPKEATYILTFEHLEKESKILGILKRLGLPLSILFGFFITVFPEVAEEIISILPSWLDLPQKLATGLDYLWGIIGNPVEKTHLIYHLPNIFLYSFGFVGARDLVNAIRKKSWLDRVLKAKDTLRTNISKGKALWDLKKGHSVLFVGSGDFIGEEIARAEKDMAITLSNKLPRHTLVWTHYDLESSFALLKKALEDSGAVDAGEYVFFPVKDSEIFLPGDLAYDLSPHKLDLLIQNIRTTESENEWTNKKIIIVGDKYHKSVIETAGRVEETRRATETITLETIMKRNPNVTLIDPTDVVLQKILELSNGRKILFRASRQGLYEYKDRFYKRIEELGYKERKDEKETFTVGYDVLEDQTEQQSIANRERGYFPVVLSSDVLDSLLKNGYRKDQLIYVPDLIISRIREIISQQ